MFRGTVISQMIGILGSLYLAKLYGTTAYGIFGVFISVVSIFSIVNTLQLEKNIITSKTISKSTNWYNFLILITPITSIILIVILYVLSEYNVLESINQKLLIWFFIGTIGISYFIINESLFIYRKKFKLLSNTKVLLTIVNVSLQVLLYSKYKINGLIYGHVISQLVVVFFFYMNNIKFIKPVNPSLIKSDLKANNTIIKYLLPGTTINAFAIHLMPILLLAFFDEKQAGIYFFATKLLTAPLFLISSSVSQVYFQKTTELMQTKKSEILRMTQKIVRSNLLLMFVILLIVNSIGMYLLELYLGPSWENIRLFTLILSFLILARTSFNPISSLIIVLNKNHVSLIFNTYLFITNLIAIYIGYMYTDIIITIIILSVFGGIGYLAMLFYFLKKLKNV